MTQTSTTESFPTPLAPPDSLTPEQTVRRLGSPTVWVVLLGITIAHLVSLWQGWALPGYFHPLDWLLGFVMLSIMSVLALANLRSWAHSRELISILIVTNVIFLSTKLVYTLFFIGTTERIETELGTTMLWMSAVPVLASSMRITSLAQWFSQTLPYTIIALSLLFGLTPQGQAAGLTIWFGLGQLGLVSLTIVLATQFLVALRQAFHKTQSSNHTLSRLAYFDNLTGLHNRTYLNQRLTELCSHRQQLAVLFFDLDGFKVINDTLGHAAGDQVLQQVARRLKEMEHATACLARVSGDEFVILLTDRSRTEIASFAQWVVTELSTPLAVNGQILRLSVSLGISVAPDESLEAQPAGRHDLSEKPGQGNSLISSMAHELLLRADRAMYAVKRSGKNGYRFYGEVVTAGDERRQLLERELRHAQERSEFFLMLQPICDLNTGEPHTIEALLRWRHHEYGLVGPDIFIPLAEESGLIASIGEWVLAAALSAVQVWQAEGFSDLKIAVNVSPLQLMQHQFVDVVRKQLEHFDLPPSVLELEVTEGVDLHDRAQVMDCLNELRALGVSLSLDDFGTGFASLSRLNELPVDTVKIDKVFVADLTGEVAPDRARYVRTLIAAMVSVAGSLNLKLIVEGVETTEQRQVLQALGCEMAQGYLFSRPITEDELRGKLWAQDWLLPLTIGTPEPEPLTELQASDLLIAPNEVRPDTEARK